MQEYFLEKDNDSKGKIMEVKLIDTTNNYMLGSYKDMNGDISIMSTGGAIVKGWKYRDEGFRTSLINTITEVGNILTIRTLNSVYKFEILKGSLKDLDLSPIEENRDNLEKFQELNSRKHTYYYCQIGGHPMIDTAVSITRLPYQMSRDEAIQYLNDNILQDSSGNIVTNILTAVDDESY